jgi:hypothetical protein
VAPPDRLQVRFELADFGTLNIGDVVVAILVSSPVFDPVMHI